MARKYQARPDGMTIREVARVLGISKARVAQIEKAALKKLHKRIKVWAKGETT
jgi:DNA-directed RNA polymerase specialized sigma subunit